MHLDLKLRQTVFEVRELHFFQDRRMPNAPLLPPDRKHPQAQLETSLTRVSRRRYPRSRYRPHWLLLLCTIPGELFLECAKRIQRRETMKSMEPALVAEKVTIATSQLIA